MNKIKLIAIGLACLMTAGVASAAQLSGGSNDYTRVDCDLLANDIKIILTSGVAGGVTCDEANNLVGLSVCHTAGLTTERSATYDHGDTMSDGTQCDDGGSGDGCSETVTGSGFPSASTANGTVKTRYPGKSCDATNAEQEATDLVAEDA
ncbi:hypothetical protein [Thiohalophilus thiocyanatoxydans]|uniref:CVNH domain-containing protein n=1 Tax=Thiohalophilus thiocyanatoxydans TaxID=381308 RepID=A0A4R8IV31_9GAMM|nr:hypothetical protein [Thiohalophilus thiocyanatoxydans]TDY01173.1 hypothetical protein EDC23_1920 [Thiohalophilus thiocyanatoxydans]